MDDEFIIRYSGLTHRELYDALAAGDPEQIALLAVSWKSIETTTRSLAAGISSDLSKLDWDSIAEDEFQRRMSVVSSFSVDLADDQQQVQTGLTQMSQSLRQAKERTEDPAETDDNASTYTLAAAGTVVLGPAGALVGGLFGHHRDEEQRAQAHDRMVKVVAELAASYHVLNQSYVMQPTTVPTDLPGDQVNSTSGPVGGARQGPTGDGGARPAAGTPEGSSGREPHTIAHDPFSRNDLPVMTGDSGTSLLGAGIGVVGGGGGGGVIGAGGIRAGSAVAGNSTALPNSGVPVAGIAAGLAGGGASLGGVLGQPNGAGTQTAGVSDSVATTNRPAGANTGNDSKTASGAGRGPTALTAVGNNPRPAAGLRGVAARPPARPGRPTRSRTGDEEDDRYDSWLTEDMMVWADDLVAAPDVLGGPDHEPPRADS